MPRNASLTYRPDIDGLRAIAVLLVVAFHASPYHITGGYIGVDVFFVISGYLISGIVLKGVTEGNFSFADFYTRRIKRIFPALLVVIPACALIGWFVMFADEYARLGKHIVAAFGFVLNFVLWGEAGYFDTSAELKPLLHLWSLSIEEQFYLVWPGLLLLVTRRGWNVLAFVSIIAVVSFAFNVALVDRHPVTAFYMPFTRAWELMLGSMLARMELAPNSAVAQLIAGFVGKQTSLRRDIIALAGIVMIAVAAVLLNSGRAFPGWWAAFPTVGTVLILLAGMQAWFNRRVLALRPLVFIGLISYPLYLWHWPLLSFTWLNANGDPPRLLRMTAVVVSVLLAWATYELLERPIRRSAGQRIAVRLAMVAIFIGGLGFVADSVGGFAFRSVNAKMLTALDIDARVGVEFRQRQQSCFGRQNPSPPFGCQQSSSSDPKIAVIGDSHSAVLFPGIVSAFPNDTIMHVETCAFPNLGLTVVNRPDLFCEPNSNEKRLEFVAAKKSVEVVILAFRGAMYVTGKGFGVSSKERDINISIESSDATSQDRVTLIEKGLSTTIDLLERAGKKVVLVADVPELGFDISDCVSGRLFATPKRLDCKIPRVAVEARRKDYGRLIERLRDRDPKLVVFDAMAVLCDNEYCYGGKDHHFFYVDDNHLGMYGSNLVGAKLAVFLSMRLSTNPKSR